MSTKGRETSAQGERRRRNASEAADGVSAAEGAGAETAAETTSVDAGRSARKTKGSAKTKKAAKKKAAAPTKKMLADAELERMNTTPMSQCAALEGLPALRFPTGAMRLGFAVKVMGQPGLKSNDTRRWQAGPHLRVSLGYLCEIFAYLRKHGISMYRMSSDLAPYATHPTMPQFHAMVRESAADLAAVGRMAREQDLRLSFHPSQFIVLNSENDELTRKSMWDLESQAEMLDRMECGPEAVLVVHVGGAYGDRESGWRRWVATWPRLGEPVRRRLVLENDDIRYSAADVLKVHEATGVKCVWDYQHHWCFNPEGLADGRDAAEVCGDLACGCAAEDALLLRADGDARDQAEEPQDGKGGGRAAAADLDGARGLQQPFRVDPVPAIDPGCGRRHHAGVEGEGSVTDPVT